MSPKKHREPTPPFKLKRVHFIVGGAVVLLFAAIAIGAFTFLGGADLSEGERERLEPPPAVGPAPRERSAAADTLASKTWEEMSDDERALVRSEIIRVYADAEFRASSERIIGIDVFRRDGTTWASRQYNEIETPGGDIVLRESLIFYCGAPDEPVRALRYNTTPLGTEVLEAPGEIGQRAWQPIIDPIDWSTVSDAGFEDVDSRRAHRLQLAYLTSPAGGPPDAVYWFDVETAQLLRYAEIPPEGATDVVSDYILDWSKPPAAVVPEGQPTTPCVEQIQSVLAESP